MKTFYRMTYNSYQASEDRKLMFEAGLELLGTVTYSDKNGDYRYLTFASRETALGCMIPMEHAYQTAVLARWGNNSL